MLLVNWQRAICLVLSDKAEIISQYNDQNIRTVTQSFAMPSVVRLTRYVRLVRRFGIVRCTRRNIILRDKCQCQYCGVQCSLASVSIDHIIPRSKGGRTVWDNVVAACQSCNRSKGDSTLEESRMILIRAPRQPSWRELLGEVDFPIEPDWLRYLDYAS